jgi:hypothetical protein
LSGGVPIVDPAHHLAVFEIDGGEDADLAAEQFRRIGKRDHRRMQIATDAGRIGEAGRRPFRHELLEDLGHGFLAVKGPPESRIDVGQVRFGKVVRGRRRLVLALGSEIRFEERRHLWGRVRSVGDLRIERFCPQACGRQQRQRGGKYRSVFRCGALHPILPCFVSVRSTD